MAWRQWWPFVAGAAVVGLIAFGLMVGRGILGSTSPAATIGLPRAHHYHSLLVSPTDPNQLLLGTHEGLYASSDGGRHWTYDALAKSDAMNLARPTGETVWLAGHEVFKKSTDGGADWIDLDPAGLPSLDIHAFAVDPRDAQSLYAAVAAKGLYHSRDGGESFTRLSERVGGTVTGLAVMPDGRILAADYERGLLISADHGATWRRPRQPVQVVGLAVNPSNSKLVLGTGAGIEVSNDGGQSWLSALDLEDGAGPVAWSSSDPSRAYVVGFNRTLYRSDDSGRSWRPVKASPE